ncbi:MAG: hypothetical protein ACTSYO_07760 [Candidatus Ranarchaeia archaeon]
MRRQKFSPFIAISIITIMIIFSPIYVTTKPPVKNDFVAPENNPSLGDGVVAISNWWNLSYLYRYNYTVHEQGDHSRQNNPVNVYATFDQNRCCNGTIRVTRWDGSTWHVLPFQQWNITMYAGTNFIKSVTLTFDVNVSQSGSSTYYIYYTRQNVGTVSYPDYYPFTYYGYVLCNLTLRGVYNNTRWSIDKWNSGTSSWTEIISGVLDAKGYFHNGSVVSSTSEIANAPGRGFYRVRSAKPIEVVAGSLEGNTYNLANDWNVAVDPIGRPVSTYYELAPFAGASNNKYWRVWILALEDGTKVSVTYETGGTPGGWTDQDGNSVTLDSSLTLNKGEYVTKGALPQGTYLTVNTTKPVAVYEGTSDAGWARDIYAYVPSLDGDYASDQFYFISPRGGSGSNYFGFFVTNIGDQQTTVTAKFMDGTSIFTQAVSAGATYFYTLTGTGSSETTPLPVINLTSSSTDVVVGTMYYVNTRIGDAGDFVPSVDGNRVGLKYIFPLRQASSTQCQVAVFAHETVHVTTNFGANQDYTLQPGQVHVEYIAADIDATVNSNASISVLAIQNAFSSGNPTGDFGVAYLSHPWTQEGSDAALTVEKGIFQQLFVFRVTVNDLANTPIEGVNVTVYYESNGSVVYDDLGNKQTGITDSNGFKEFVGLTNTSFIIRAWIEVDSDSGGWLNTYRSSYKINASKTQVPTDFITDITITQLLANVSLHLKDLDGDALSNQAGETIEVQAINRSLTPPVGRLDNQYTDINGNITFYRLPSENYSFYVLYSNPSTLYSYSTESNTLPAYNYSISGPASYNLTIPLTTLIVNVTSYDNRQVDGVGTEISQTGVNALNGQTNSSGLYTFYRIRNGTWTISATKIDNYGQSVVNNTVQCALQGYTVQLIEFPITRLSIEVVRSDDLSKIEYATVSLNRSSTEIATGQTNSSGQFTFFWLKSQSYGINVTAGLSNNDLVTSYYIGKNWNQYPNGLQIQLAAPQYSKPYTIIVNRNSSATYTVYFNDTIVLSVDYLNRTSTLPDTNVAHDSTTYVRFRLYGGLGYTTLFYTLEWTTTAWNMTGTVNGTHFNATIPTGNWQLNASSTYKIQVTAHTDGYTDPLPFDYYITIQKTPTEIIGPSAIDMVWSRGEDQLFNYHDTVHDVYINDSALATYEFLGASVSGSLINLGNGSYELDESPFNLLDIGNYTLRVVIQHKSYVNLSMLIDVSVSIMPTSASVLADPSNAVWGPSSQWVNVSYYYNLPANSSEIDPASVTITMEWIPLSQGLSGFTISLTSYKYQFSADSLNNGTWVIRFTIERSNFETQVFNTSQFTISQAPIEILNVSSKSVTVQWQETAVYNIIVNRTDIDLRVDGMSIFSHNWSESVLLVPLGNGQYQIKISSSVPAENQTIRVYLFRGNCSLVSVDFEIKIIIPLQLSNDIIKSGDLDNPLNIYYTHSVLFPFSLYDRSRSGTNVTGATVMYNWSAIGEQGQMAENSTVLGQYYLVIHGNATVPGSYIIHVNASKLGYSSTTFDLYLVIANVSSDIIVINQPTNPVYEDTLVWRFYWNNTIDNAPITSPSSTYFALYRGGILFQNITTLVDYQNGTYQLTVGSAAAGLDAGQAYQLTAVLSRLGFDTAQLQFSAFPLGYVETSISVSLSEDTVEQGRTTNVTLTVQYYRTISGDGLSGANVTASFNNETYTLQSTGSPGVYVAVIPVQGLSIDVYKIEVEATRQNYQSKTASVNLVVEEITLFELPIFGKVRPSTMIVYGGGIILPVVVFASVVAYKRISMPYDLKVINKALRQMMKGEAVDTQNLKIPERGDAVLHALREDFEIAGISFPIEEANEEL